MNWSLAPGDVLAHYRVVSPLGSGGMGQVYLAEDVRLGRKLALKVLSPRALREPERLRRFEREARTISSLNHPNILTIYDIGDADGVQFIATEYIDGLTLRAVLERGRLEVRRALDIAMQVGQALAAAHAAGVIHRDVKPENVMVRADGYVKVLDFGLVKLTSPESSPDATARTELVDTKEGLVMGSVSYMAPEQARGGDIDARVDVFAFGIVLYEMLAGEPPFKGPTVADVLGAVLFKDPEPLARLTGVPVQLDRIVSTALRKNRDQRYPTVAHLLADLGAVTRTVDIQTERGWSATPGTGQEQQTSAGFAVPALKRVKKRAKRVIDSLAVLPLVNQSQDQELDYLSDGLTESLINSLSQIPRLRVMARSTVFRYKGQNLDPRVVGRQLDVKAVLTGHLRQRGHDFIVGAELVDVDDGAQLWGTLLNRRPSDVFVLQAEISRELTDALRLRLTRDEKSRLVKPYTVNAVAYQAYLRGRYFVNQRTVDALRESRRLFERAVAEDPQYALAYAGLADCCSLLAVSYRTPSLTGLIEQARTAAQTALSLDEGLAEAHASLAFIKFRFDWDWQGAEVAFTRALELNPGHAPSRQWHAMFLAARGRFELALGEMRRALQFDLLSLIIQTGIGRILHFAGRYDEALLQYEHVLQTNPGFAQTRIDLALTRIARAEYAAAREELDLAEGLFGSVSTIVLLKGICAVREGRVDEGREAFAALEERYTRGTAGPDDLALMAAVLGDWPLARHWLNEACAQRAPFLGYVDVEPAMAPLHEDAACRALLQRYGFGLT
jgi:serine/threonine protein kinase/tetratricopeptide (TPR) repeat protein